MGAISLRAEIDRRINFAMQQNDVPIVKSVQVENGSAEPLRGLRLQICAEPAFAEPWHIGIDFIAGRTTYNVTAVDLALSTSVLGELTERVRGRLRLAVFCGAECLAERQEDVQLFARDEWSGLASLPEILAAFVMPNHPGVESVLNDAAQLLGEWTGDPSLSGYQSRDPKRSGLMAAAIYTALQRLGITYVNPPASFEAEGQRIRLPDRILQARLATCLDLAVLAAGCLEQAGLHSLVVIVSGHAFAGVWLTEDCFAEPAVEEPLRLRKRVDLGEILVFDPTVVTARPALDFAAAVREAKRRLERPEEFRCLIDIARARKGQIRPLPERVQRPESEVPDVPPQPLAPVLPDVSAFQVPCAPPKAKEGERESPATRVDRWCRRLLDLSLRNRLLNFRETQKTIPLLCPDLAAVEHALTGGAAFPLLPRPKDLGPGDPRDPHAYRRRTADEAIAALLREELRAARLYADLTAEELDRRQLEVYRADRLSREEGDASALYLALGFLLWYEAPQSAQPRLAPILLLPIEIHRKSAREGFTIRLADDDPRVNVTLLEFLQKGHGIVVSGLDPLPEDERGLDVAAVLRAFRAAIRDIDRWDVLETASIGIFSFAKFLMWRDLAERTEELTRNPVVDHLVSRPHLPFDGDAAFPDPDRLDEDRSPLQTFCPLPADASQLAAIFAAAEGRSFVLEGPPGTGKSQTITNLVAHCLAEGKTVLFVSEKMAALSVVHDRLQKVGLGQHCLELHSSKAQKQHVLAQLDDALDQATSRPPEEWAADARRLEGLRRELNAYVQALHRRRSTGESVFQAVSRLIGLRDVPCVDLAWPSPDALDAAGLAQLRDLVGRLATAAAAVGEAPGHPWEAAACTDWTPEWERAVRLALDRLQAALPRLETCARDASTSVTLAPDHWSLDDLTLLDDIAQAFLESPGPPAPILVRPDWEEIQEQIRRWMEHGRRRDAQRAEVFARVTPKILDLDLDALEAELVRARASWWPAGWWRERRVRNALRAVARDGRAPGRDELGGLLQRAQALRKEERGLAAAGDEARSVLGRLWNNGEAEWDRLESVRSWTQRFRSLAARAAKGDLQQAGELRERWARLVTEGRDLLSPEGDIGRRLVAFRSAHAAFQEARAHAERLLVLDAAQAWGAPGAADALAAATRTVNGWREHAAELRAWCAWRRARAEAVRANLARVIEAYERGLFPSRDLQRVFERSYSAWWYGAVLGQEPVLAQFFSPEHERKIEQFRAVDDAYLALTPHYVRARLAGRVPAATEVALPTSEVGILKREIGKKRRQLAVRRLFQAIPNLLPRLKPCLLMSPMSVAQYLDPSYPPFDLVVFDEASQIPVWDAIGALARGKQAVIVGDPRQLPPTTFFQRADGLDEEPSETEAVEDLESILDECIGAGLRTQRLSWHYRSRHESLIAFSNFHYYKNRLLTFPSPLREGMGVSFRHVPDGLYDRGKSATNRAEAEAVVAEILSRLRDSARQRWSMGVVTFSQAQQTLIEDLLENERRKDPEVDAFFAEDVPEPVFVKNLENVQGDERDVILFSICYGPDALGRVSMNFGPLNQDGGERRLNVAITRARREVIVFSTLRAEQIDLARTRARGVHDLKNFLEYAERGPAALGEARSLDPEADADSPFELAVRDALVAKGWQVHQQVGCARYRIDLAVVDPESPGRYLLGIECDGAMYHRAKTARDRDKLRESVLRDLGWRLHRIWSTDWWTNPERELQKLEAALARSRSEPAGGAADRKGPKPPAHPGRIAAAPGPAEAPARPAALCDADPPTYSLYPRGTIRGTPDEFYASASDRAIRQLLVDVVKHEGPVGLELAARRIAWHWHLQRVTEKTVKRVRGLLRGLPVRLVPDSEGAFLWPSDLDPAAYRLFRVPGGDPETVRGAAELPAQEIGNAILYLLRQHISVPEEDLIREVGRTFGFHRTGCQVEARIRGVINDLVRQGAVSRHNGMVALPER